MSTLSNLTDDEIVSVQSHIPVDQKHSFKSPASSRDVNFALLQAQLRITQAAQVLREHGLSHGLGENKRTASLASTPYQSSSTPELVCDGAASPYDEGSVIRTPGDNRAEYFNIASRNASCIRLEQLSRSEIYESDIGSEVGKPQPGTVSPVENSQGKNIISHSGQDEEGEEGLHSRLRSVSFSTLPRPAPVALRSSPSLPILQIERPRFPFESVLSPERRLILPGQSSTTPRHGHDKNTTEDAAEALARAEGSTDVSAGGSSKPSFRQRISDSIIATYAPKDPPPLILPTAPTDAEKASYLKSNRLGLYGIGVFSLLSLSAGMWLFVISAIPFYWFGAVVVLLQSYLFISYTVSIVGKDFDFEDHKKILEQHPITPETAPTVDIYLPCCKEPIEVLENTYNHIRQLQWPAAKLKVYVLDDGGLDTVKALAAQYGFEYICRDDRPRLKKAGNLRWAFARTNGDFFTIYDADFCPRPDFLMEIIPQHLAHPDTAIVQTPQFFRTSSQQTWVEQGAGSVQELFYRIIQVNRNRWGASICVGSNAVYRREALVEVGGTAEIGFSEDVHTGFYALTRGWGVRYVPLCLACGICPDTPRAFFSQQMRWCMGSTTLLTNPDFWRSSLSWVQKICYLSGMMYYSATALSIFLNPVPGILMIWVRPEYVRYYNLSFALPSVLYSLIVIRCWTKASYGLHVQFIMVIQAYAYLTAIKDRLFGRALAWVPSGDTKAHKNNKYRNMRILACCWVTAVTGALVSGVVFQVLRGLAWYDCLPVLLLDAFNIFLAHRFLLCHGKL